MPSPPKWTARDTALAGTALRAARSAVATAEGRRRLGDAGGGPAAAAVAANAATPDGPRGRIDVVARRRRAIPPPHAPPPLDLLLSLALLALPPPLTARAVSAVDDAGSCDVRDDGALDGAASAWAAEAAVVVAARDGGGLLDDAAASEEAAAPTPVDGAPCCRLVSHRTGTVSRPLRNGAPSAAWSSARCLATSAAPWRTRCMDVVYRVDFSLCRRLRSALAPPVSRSVDGAFSESSLLFDAAVGGASLFYWFCRPPISREGSPLT